jgi:hypothetical protein
MERRRGGLGRRVLMRERSDVSVLAIDCFRSRHVLLVLCLTKRTEVHRTRRAHLWSSHEYSGGLEVGSLLVLRANRIPRGEEGHW